jgi:hypothetical protein
MRSPLRIQRGGADFLDMANVEYVWNSFLKPNITEQIRILPDSLIFGSLLVALLTQSFSTVVFALSLLETGLVGKGLQAFFQYMDIVHTSPSVSANPAVCLSSYATPTLETIMSFGKSEIPGGVPSFPIFFLAAASAYVVGGMIQQKKELEALGTAYSARFYMAILTTMLLLLAVSAYRMAMGCDSFGFVALSLGFGFIVGGLILYQNTSLFGRDSTNLLGIPLLRERTRDGKPLYVCPQKTSSSA